MSFVRLENLNDFIQPSTACIKPVEKKAIGVVAKVNDVNLSDCLACSGCITSAESVLVQQQNYDELFKIINDNKTTREKKEIVVSLSLQSLASLAHKYSLDVQETAERVASFFVSLGCNKVYDINLARHLALVESYREYKTRSSEKTPKLPIISSVCPGWICYAEKTNGDLVIPYLSKVRSPQQIMGSILKKNYKSEKGELIERANIYHVTLMPCFDKKLEASRQEFKNNLDGSQDVDCVLTPIELEEILLNEEVSLNDFSPKKLDILTETGFEFDKHLTSNLGSVSGGYAENILLAEASSILQDNCDNLKSNLKYSTLKNGDFIEVTLESLGEQTCGGGGDTIRQQKLPKMAIVNGFRNIQTVVQRLKRKALKYDYIEIMACPSGCINGGAQCRPNNGENQEQMLKITRSLYDAIPKTSLDIDENKINSEIYEKLDISDPNQLLYTDFHAVPKMQNLTVNW